MMKINKLLSLFMVGIMSVTIFTGCNNEEKKENAIAEKTAIEITKDMGNGWNLGNTMEAVAAWLGSDATPKDYEKAWGQPETTKETIDGIKSAGFNSVRIPVAWSNMMENNGEYVIPEDYIKRVDEIIGYVLENDMYAVVNIHWDGGWWEKFGSDSEKEREEAMKKYKAMWTQLSAHYADYSYKLILESANEELGNSLGKGLSEDERYEKCNEINQTFIDIVRNSGGKNDKRFLLIAGYNTDIDKTCDERFIMPTDTLDNHLMISVHYYTPSTFCIATNEKNSWGYMDSWGADEDYDMMREYFEKMKKFTDEGYGVIIGEYGVTEKSDDDNQKSIKEGSDKFLASVVDMSKEYGYCSMLWDTGTWYDRTEHIMKDENVAKAYKTQE